MVKKTNECAGESRSSSIIPIPQSSVIPFRRGRDGFEICLITSRKRQLWIFPKTTALRPLDAYDAAINAAAIEAGLHGRVLDAPVGSYRHMKEGKLHQVTVFLMEVSRCADQWCEAQVRARRWASAQDARHLIVKEELRYMLEQGLARLGRDPAGR